MPGFDLNPAVGTQSYGNPATGATYVVKKKKGGGFKGTDVRDIKINDKPSRGASSSGGASSKSSDKKKGGNKNKNKGKQQPAEYNPLLAPFKTPNQIRAEAAALAAMGVPTEESLRSQQALEQKGLEGLTTALSGRLAGLSAESAAQNRALLSGYQGIAGQAQAAGESAVAAAGGPAGITPTAPSEVTANTLAALGAIPQTYAPAAELTGAGLVGQSRLNLTKALAQRSGQISADTAKYLQQLQDREVQRAISSATLEQNQARLNLSNQQQDWRQKVDLTRLGYEGQRIQLAKDKAAQAIINSLGKGQQSTQKKIQAAKNAILNNRGKWTIADDPSKATWDLPYMYNGQTFTASGTGATESEARQNAISKMSPDNQAIFTSGNASWMDGTQGKSGTRQATAAEIMQNLVPILVNAGMKRKNAIAWVRINFPQAYNVSGAYTGGVTSG